MRTTTLYNSLVVMAVVAVVSGCTSKGSANRSIEPPFEWDITGEFATPDTSLTLTELGRTPMGEKVFISYEIKATGFASDEPLRMWSKIGHDYNRLSGSVDNDGLFKITGMDSPFGVMDFVPGQPLDIAIISETTDKRAHAKVFPYPIEAHGTNGCSILMSLQSATGRLWFATLRGFKPGQPIQIISQFMSETFETTEPASDRGEFRWMIRFERGARGVASITATGGDRTVSVQYNVGYDAIHPTDTN